MEEKCDEHPSVSSKTSTLPAESSAGAGPFFPASSEISNNRTDKVAVRNEVGRELNQLNYFRFPHNAGPAMNSLNLEIMAQRMFQQRFYLPMQLTNMGFNSNPNFRPSYPMGYPPPRVPLMPQIPVRKKSAFRVYRRLINKDLPPLMKPSGRFLRVIDYLRASYVSRLYNLTLRQSSVQPWIPQIRNHHQHLAIHPSHLIIPEQLSNNQPSTSSTVPSGPARGEVSVQRNGAQQLLHLIQNSSSSSIPNIYLYDMIPALPANKQLLMQLVGNMASAAQMFGYMPVHAVADQQVNFCFVVIDVLWNLMVKRELNGFPRRDASEDVAEILSILGEQAVEVPNVEILRDLLISMIKCFDLLTKFTSKSE